MDKNSKLTKKLKLVKEIKQFSKQNTIFFTEGMKTIIASMKKITERMKIFKNKNGSKPR